jgi:hypothetical protein
MSTVTDAWMIVSPGVSGTVALAVAALVEPVSALLSTVVGAACFGTASPSKTNARRGSAASGTALVLHEAAAKSLPLWWCRDLLGHQEEA